MAGHFSDISDKADAAFRAAMITVIETCKRTKTPLLTRIDGVPMSIPYDEIEQYFDVEALRQQVEQERPDKKI